MVRQIKKSKPIGVYASVGNVDIYCGDCAKVLQSLDTKIGLVVTDPPFGIGYQNNFTKNIHSKIFNDQEPFDYRPFAKETFRLQTEGTAIFAYTCWSEYGRNVQELQESGYIVKEPLVVQKRPSGKTDIKGTFQSNSDWILFAVKGKFSFQTTKLLRNKKAGTIPNPGRKPVPEFKTRFPSSWFGTEYPYSTENPSTRDGRIHPARKNILFTEWLIKIASKLGDTVLDPFGGSGTIPLACMRTNRKCIVVEYDPVLCDMIYNVCERELIKE